MCALIFFHPEVRQKKRKKEAATARVELAVTVVVPGGRNPRSRRKTYQLLA